MHTFSLHLDSRFQNLPLLSNELYDPTLKGWSLFQIKEKKDAFVQLSGDLQWVQFRYPATQLLYPSCFCFASESDPCLYNLSNTSKTRDLPYSWQFPWVRWCLTSKSQYKRYWAFSPCRDLSTRKSWTWFRPEPVITTSIHQPNHSTSIIMAWYPWCSLSA